MNNHQRFLEAFKRNLYIQGFNAYPIFLNRAGISGFEMEKSLGYGYSVMLYYYKNGYCEMHYLSADLKRIWQEVKKNLKKDPDYIKKMAAKYFKIFAHHLKLFKKLDQINLAKVSDLELINLAKQSSQALIDAVGVAHLVDPIGIGAENEFKQKLLRELADKTKFNEYYPILTKPSKLSFLAEEERTLRKIATLPDNKKQTALETHLQKYFWINNSYAGPTNITVYSLKRRLNVLSKEKIRPKISKQELIQKLKLNPELKQMIDLIDFTTIWQDQRKKNVLISVAYFSKVISEISQRVKVSDKLLYFLGIEDFNNLKSLADLKTIKDELEKRSQGVFFLHDHGQELVASGEKYQALLPSYQQMAKTSFKLTEDLHGSVANRGTAIGRVVICKDLESIQRVKIGDVIVASMTRPEFMPALKKASAIITDEGGVTCHAAILSRELGIPAIIGTKIATKILKDGMNVEVRANHGIVRIIG